MPKTFKNFVRDMYRENEKERRTWRDEPIALASYYRRNREWLRELYKRHIKRG